MKIPISDRNFLDLHLLRGMPLTGATSGLGLAEDVFVTSEPIFQNLQRE